MITFDQDERDQDLALASIKVVGVGGAGGNTINCMVDSQYNGVEFIAINTDAQALKHSKAHHTIQIGQKSTKGLGAGANPEVGKRSAEEDIDKVLELLHGADIVFVAGGMGGGTGSGALPVIVKALKEKGILTIVILTKPFAFEGKKRARVADEAIEVVKKYADTLLVIPNQKLLDLVDDQVSMIDGFGMINEVLNKSVRGIADIITRSGHINVDFADVKEIMKDKGLAVMGTARASGEGRAKKATLQAISSPLLESMNIAGARGVLLNITGGPNLGLHEISQAASIIYEQADADANIILGSVIDLDMKDEVSVTVIATGFTSVPKQVLPEAVEQVKIAEFVAAAPVAPVYAQPVQQVAQPVVVQHVAPEPVMVHVAPVHVAPTPVQVVPVQAAPVYVAPQPAVVVQPVAQSQAVQAAPAMPVMPTATIEPAARVIEEPELPTSCEVPPLAQQPQQQQERSSCKLEQATTSEVIYMAPAVSEPVAQEAVCKAPEPVRVECQEAASVLAQKEQHVPVNAAGNIATPSGVVNLQDLDIPTFMRKQYQQKNKNEQ